MAETGCHRRVVQIIGDGANGRWLTWRWNDGQHGVGVQRTQGLEEAVEAFAKALPGPPRGRQREQQLASLGLLGPLTRGKDERDLMRRLSAALLPDELRRQLLEHRGPLEVRVAPSPLAAAVPWGLLVLEDNTRLLDVADVSWLGPVLPRDLGGLSSPGVQAGANGSRALYVEDPYDYPGDKVLPTGFSRCSCHGPETSLTIRSRWQLKAELDAGASRLLMVGHCQAVAGGSDIAFMFDGPPRSRRNPGQDFWSRQLRASQLVADAGSWPMPARAGVVACASGIDLRQYEPFGLGTALLLAGAEQVQLTLWTLPTDYAVSLLDPTAAGGFARLVQAVDHAQSSDDPVAELCRFQREQLALWRDEPGLATTPLLWGSIITMTAPRGRLLTAGDSADPTPGATGGRQCS